MIFEPIREIGKLYDKEHIWENLGFYEANEKLKVIKSDHLLLKAKLINLAGVILYLI